MLELAAGDAVVVPAGVAHCRRWASADLSVVGAYPHGQDWDLCRVDDLNARAAALPRIPRVPLPAQDPVQGRDGPLAAAWGIPQSTGGAMLDAQASCSESCSAVPQ